MSSAEKIAKECDRIKELLLSKNRKYGDSAFSTGELFQVPPLTAIKARINDKISRIKNQPEDEDEDVVDDLVGYLILYLIERKKD